MSLCDICIFSLASPWMCPGTVSTNSNTAGLLWEIHLPSLGMPKWLWRCNSLILGSEQCSSYCYGKSMWLSWRAASTGFCWGVMEQSFNLCRRHHQIKGKNPKTHHTVLALLNRGVVVITAQQCVECRWVSDKVWIRIIDDTGAFCFILPFALCWFRRSIDHLHVLNKQWHHFFDSITTLYLRGAKDKTNWKHHQRNRNHLLLLQYSFKTNVLAIICILHQ